MVSTISILDISTPFTNSLTFSVHYSKPKTSTRVFFPKTQLQARTGEQFIQNKKWLILSMTSKVTRNCVNKVLSIIYKTVPSIVIKTLSMNIFWIKTRESHWSCLTCTVMSYKITFILKDCSEKSQRKCSWLAFRIWYSVLKKNVTKCRTKKKLFFNSSNLILETLKYNALLVIQL
jgi:hypothetical protein